MRVAQLHTRSLERLMDGTGVDAEVCADIGERMPSSIKLRGLRDHIGRQLGLTATEVDAFPLQMLRHCVSVDAVLTGKVKH